MACKIETFEMAESQIKRWCEQYANSKLVEYPFEEVDGY